MTPEQWALRKANIGRNIRARRDDVSQEKLADKAGIASLTVSRLERGVHGTSVATICKLADAMGVPPHYLLLNIDRSEPVADPAP